MLLLLLLAVADLPLAAGARAENLTEFRAARRRAMREAVRAKTAWPVPFGILVIPIDFADARFDPGFDPAAELLPRLAGSGPGSLDHYFEVASRGRTGLVLQLAPVARLPGTRADYYGEARQREMARQALQRAAAMGAAFSSFDLDHDGEGDGVLLLHSGPGFENDPAGLIFPLQDVIDPPVVQGGVWARSFAVASARSSLGIWAHEVGHLLGLEDRYDPVFPSNSQTPPAGGLVRFSLMASGWLGTGLGEDPSLPDGYSRLLLGWVDLGPQPGPSTVVRLDFQDGPGQEFFLVERRFPELTAPYDAGLPSQRLMILHVDETLAEGQAAGSGWTDRHLRANLVQADGGDSIALGLSQGAAADLFPSDGAWQAFNDQTIPSSRSFGGLPTGIDAVTAVAGGQVQFTRHGTASSVDLRLVFSETAGVLTPTLLARLLVPGEFPAGLDVALTCADTLWGQFSSGASLEARLARLDPGQESWADYRAGDLPAWLPAGTPPDDASTVFHYAIEGGAWGSGNLAWVWNSASAPLDLQDGWPGSWQESHPTGDSNTRWHRWTDGPSAQGRMLACTGAEETSAERWPDVRYGNNAHAVLMSPLLGAAVRWLELTHAVDLELLYPGVSVDGVTLSWVHAGGRAIVPAEPADGWLGTIRTKARHPLAGRPTFAVREPLAGSAQWPLWRREILPLPAAEEHGPGPWRLQLELASNPAVGVRGWLVRDLGGQVNEPPPSAFPLAVEGRHLRWTWNSDAPVDVFEVDDSADGGRTWTLAAVQPAGRAEGSLPLDRWAAMANQRTLFRVRALRGADTYVSREVAFQADRVAALGSVFPNPARRTAHLALDGAGDAAATLSLHDLRGRLVRRWKLDGSARIVQWDGTDDSARPVAAGTYLFRLRAGGRTLTRKVAWMP